MNKSLYIKAKGNSAMKKHEVGKGDNKVPGCYAGQNAREVLSEEVIFEQRVSQPCHLEKELSRQREEHRQKPEPGKF